jgi:hypothetical protein
MKKIVQQVKSDCGFKKKESLYFAALKKDVVWLKKEFEAKKNWNACKMARSRGN